MKENIYDYDDLLEMLDSFFRDPKPFWDQFYSDRNKNIPFFAECPDENLVSYFENGVFSSGKVLELGCGPGRNAIYFAKKGCTIDAVDLSKETLQWAEERATEKNVSINFINENIFDLPVEEGTYDIVYDSGCFHHIAPHRRMTYIDLVKRALKPNGYFALTCFVQGGEYGGAEISDWEVYRLQSLMGGLGYTEDKLRSIFKDFHDIEIRKMRSSGLQEGLFGVPGFLAALFQK
jgi:SAM-dependent methyltransferase